MPPNMPVPLPARLAAPRLRLAWLARSVALLGSALLISACSRDRPPEAPAQKPADTSLLGPAEPEASSPASEAAAQPASAPAAGGSEHPPSGPRDARGKEQIQQVLADNRQKVRDCYDAALAANPGIKGDLVISFVIDPEGAVKQAEVNWSESDLHIPELDTCAVNAVRSLKFPASSRGLESKVNYPFNFNPQPPKGNTRSPSAH
jgi:TonB family protein